MNHPRLFIDATRHVNTYSSWYDKYRYDNLGLYTIADLETDYFALMLPKMRECWYHAVLFR